MNGNYKVENDDEWEEEEIELSLDKADKLIKEFNSNF